MPKPIQITKDMIMDAGLTYIKKYGYQDLSARKIAKELKASTQPIYSYYSSIDLLMSDLLKVIHQKLLIYMSKDTGHDPFLQMGLGVVAFAKEEPQWYRCLIFSNHTYHSDYKDYLEILRKDKHLEAIAEDTLLSYHSMLSIFTHGLACIVMDDPNRYTNEAIITMLTHAAQSFFKHIKEV